jgi:hypothetical protein
MPLSLFAGRKFAFGWIYLLVGLVLSVRSLLGTATTVELLPDRIRLKKVRGSDEILYGDLSVIAVVPRRAGRATTLILRLVARGGAHAIEIPVTAFGAGEAGALTAALGGAVPAVAATAAESGQKLAAREAPPDH